MRPQPSFFLVLLALLCTSEVAALGLGQVTVRSHLGARFHAEVELLAATNDSRAAAECFLLSQPADLDSGIPVLTQARISLDNRNGKPRLIIRSEQSINDPVLLLSLRARCGVEVVRDYMLIIDPAETPTVKPGSAIPRIAGASQSLVQATARPPRTADQTYPEHWQVGQGESARSIAASLFPRQPRAQRRFLKALRAANPEVDFGSRDDTLLAAGTPLYVPDTRVKPSLSTDQAKAERAAPRENEPPRTARKNKPPALAGTVADGMSDRLSISGSTLEMEALPDGLPLRLATDLFLPISARTTENQRSILRMEYKLLAAIYDQARQQLGLAEQVRELESSVAELQAATENSARPAVPTEAQATLPPAPVAMPEVKAAIPLQPVRHVVEEAADNTIWSVGLAASLGAAAFLFWRLRRRFSKPSPVAPRLEPESLPPETALPGSPVDNTPSMTVSEKTPIAQPALVVENSEKTPEPKHAIRAPDPVSTQGAAVLTEQYEFNPVMELADIMLAFGRVKGATEALLDYIKVSPDGALQPWMKLMDIYRQGEMRQEFEDLTQELNRHFNVAPAEWEEISDLTLQHAAIGDEETVAIETLLSRLPHTAEILHIREEITRTWGTAEGLAYLNKLLRDNRQGKRRGFTLATVSELLFLLDVLERRLHGASTSS